MPRETFSGGGRDDDRDYGQGGWGYSGYAREGQQPVDPNRRGDLGDDVPDPDIEAEGRVDLGFGRRRGDYEASDRAFGPPRYAEGPFRGRGPRGYARTDARIREDVCEALTEAPDLDAREIEVEVRNGEVTLSGRVDSRRDKRRAEDLAEAASGVRHVQNDLRPRTPDSGIAPVL